MICEFCKKSHNGEFASGRFCEEVCYRKFVSLKRNFKQKEKIKKEQENYILNPKKCNNCSCDLSYEKRKRKFCSKNCSVKDEWCGKKIVLQFDHINGKKNDHRPENIRWLCPNCHSQTNTFAGKNLKNPLRISSKKIQD